MPRIRTIKPDFWSHPIMGRADDSTKCLAISLLNFSDDEGFFLAEPNLVRSWCRPFDDDSTITRRCLDKLEECEWIEIKFHPTHGPIGCVITFVEHQKIDRPKPSTLKVYFFDDQSTINRRSIAVGKESNGMEQGMEGNAAPPIFIPLVEEPQKKKRVKTNDVKITDLKGEESIHWFDKMWKNWPKTGTKWVDMGYGKGREEVFDVVKGSKAQAERNFQKIVDSKVATPRELAYASTFYWESDNPKKGYYQNVSTFFGPEKATWREFLDQAKQCILDEDKDMAHAN